MPPGFSSFAMSTQSNSNQECAFTIGFAIWHPPFPVYHSPPLSHHFPTFLGAVATGIGTLAAVIMIVSFTNFCAYITNFSTGAANSCNTIAAARHGAHSKVTDLGTIKIRAYAVRHHFRFRLIQTSCGATITGYCTGLTRSDADHKFFM